MPLDLAAIPIVDNHCHSLLREQPADDPAFRNHLTESYIPEVARDDVLMAALGSGLATEYLKVRRAEAAAYAEQDEAFELDQHFFKY